MKRDDPLSRQIEILVLEAEQAIDPSSNGLLDRGDYCDIVARLLVSARMLLAEVEKLKRERDELDPRPSRISIPDPDPATVPPSLLYQLARGAHSPRRN